MIGVKLGMIKLDYVQAVSKVTANLSKVFVRQKYLKMMMIVNTAKTMVMLMDQEGCTSHTRMNARRSVFNASQDII